MNNTISLIIFLFMFISCCYYLYKVLLSLLLLYFIYCYYYLFAFILALFFSGRSNGGIGGETAERHYRSGATETAET